MTAQPFIHGRAGGGARQEAVRAIMSAVQFDTAGGCWLADRSGPNGYGLIRHLGKRHLIHRLSWEAHNGPIPDGACVLHKCDTPPCCNPAHLFLGTPQDNSADMVRKRRFAAKLTPDDVRFIRAHYSPGRGRGSGPLCGRALARRFGVSQRTVNMLLHGETWGHIQ